MTKEAMDLKESKVGKGESFLEGKGRGTVQLYDDLKETKQNI